MLNKILITIGVFIVLIISTYWFVGSSFYPRLVIPDQYKGESIYIGRAVSITPTLLVIYPADTFPDPAKVSLILEIPAFTIYGNFDFILDSPDDVSRGKYIAVLYTNWNHKNSIVPGLGPIVRDAFGRQAMTSFEIK